MTVINPGLDLSRPLKSKIVDLKLAYTGVLNDIFLNITKSDKA